MRKLALTGAVLLVTLTGCGTSAPAASSTVASTTMPSATAEQPTSAPSTAPTLETVWEMIEPGDTSEIRDQLVSTICDGFASGVDYATQVDAIAVARGVSKVTADLMIHAAVEYSCPEHMSQLPGAS